MTKLQFYTNEVAEIANYPTVIQVWKETEPKNGNRELHQRVFINTLLPYIRAYVLRAIYPLLLEAQRSQVL